MTQSLLTFKEAQNYLRISRSTLFRFMQAGKVQGYKVGNHWRFYAHELDRCVQAMAAPVMRMCNHTETQLWCQDCINYVRLQPASKC